MASAAQRPDDTTPTRILDIAERLVQTRGYNGFSYADVASELGVTKASVHYHFAGKAELGEALIVRYTRRFGDALVEIDERVPDALGKLRAYGALYAGVLRDRRMCLCGMLAAEHDTLPDPVRQAVVAFFDASEDWLAGVLAQGRAEGTLSFDGPAEDAARLIVGGLEGAMLVARPYGDVARFEAAADRLLGSFVS